MDHSHDKIDTNITELVDCKLSTDQVEEVQTALHLNEFDYDFDVAPVVDFVNIEVDDLNWFENRPSDDPLRQDSSEYDPSDDNYEYSDDHYDDENIIDKVEENKINYDDDDNHDDYESISDNSDDTHSQSAEINDNNKEIEKDLNGIITNEEEMIEMGASFPPRVSNVLQEVINHDMELRQIQQPSKSNVMQETIDKSNENLSQRRMIDDEEEDNKENDDVITELVTKLVKSAKTVDKTKKSTGIKRQKVFFQDYPPAAAISSTNAAAINNPKKYATIANIGNAADRLAQLQALHRTCSKAPTTLNRINTISTNKITLPISPNLETKKRAAQKTKALQLKMEEEEKLNKNNNKKNGKGGGSNIHRGPSTMGTCKDGLPPWRH